MNRRQFFQSSGLMAVAAQAVQPTPASPAEIYKLLGFTTMSGEDPLKLWARLRDTREWLAGPLAPDGWCGQVFAADHGDIFAFRFLSLPASWITPAGGKSKLPTARNSGPSGSTLNGQPGGASSGRAPGTTRTHG